MSRVINSDSPGQNRSRLLKLLSTTLTVVKENNLTANELNDALAFIVLSLMEIERTIAKTTAPWEKREYWIKADQFRSEWKWVGEIYSQLIRSQNEKGWTKIPDEIGILESKLKTIETPKRLNGKAFWKGAYKVLSGR